MQRTDMARLARLGLPYGHGKDSSTASMSCHPTMHASVVHGERAATMHGRAYMPVLATWSAR